MKTYRPYTHDRQVVPEVKYKLSEKTPPQKKHMGTKFLGHFFGMVLAFIYAALQFFSKKILLIDDLYNIALVTVFFVVV